MTEYVKGTYPLETEITEPPAPADPTAAFERAALARLGGSICFVSTQPFLWTGDVTGPADRREA